MPSTVPHPEHHCDPLLGRGDDHPLFESALRHLGVEFAEVA
ncbi:MAG: hypothetical protein AAGF99_11215 [Bacteroidota bacterium]